MSQRHYAVRSAGGLPVIPPGPAEQLQGLPELQTRTVQRLSLRVGESDEGTFDGYACVWDTEDSYGTRFLRGCFTAGGLDQLPYALLWMHDPTLVLGLFYAAEDSHGLHVTGRWDDTQAGQDARARARSGSAPELSVGFVPIGTSPDDDRAFTVCRLVETSQITARMASVPGASLVGVRQHLAPVVGADGAAGSHDDALEANARLRRAQLAGARLRLALPPQ